MIGTPRRAASSGRLSARSSMQLDDVVGNGRRRSVASSSSVTDTSSILRTRIDLSNGTSSPCRPCSARQTSAKRSIPIEFSALCEFVDGEPDRLVNAQAQWRPLAENLLISCEEVVEAHVKSCNRCRAFSVFSKAVGPKTRPPLTEMSLQTLCRVSLGALNSHIAETVVKAKEPILAAIAQSIGVLGDDFVTLDAVARQRLDSRFASLLSCAAERDRILAQATIREELRPEVERLENVQNAVTLWFTDIAPRLGKKGLLHKQGSVVHAYDIEDHARKMLHCASVKMTTSIAAWEAKYKVCFEEVFSTFGIPFHHLDLVSLDEQAKTMNQIEDEDCSGLQVDLDDDPLGTEQIESIRPMTVAVRIRPILAHEAGDEITSRVMEDAKTIAFRVSVGRSADNQFSKEHLGDRGTQTLSFDIGIHGNQAAMFSRCGIKALVHKALEGHHATVFAYGQTGAGKTHTLMGSMDRMTLLADDVPQFEDKNLPPECQAFMTCARKARVKEQGLLPRAAQFLYKLIGLQKDTDAWVVNVSFVEIYNEKVFDLLSLDGKNLEVRQKSRDMSDGFQVPDLTQVECKAPENLLQMLAQGVKNRHTAGHSLSKDSSRAHALFIVDIGRPGGSQPGKLIFADLAGSERQKRIQGASTIETASINKSLLMLSNCVSALAAGRNQAAQPSAAFRNSKLTKILMESLCGFGYTLLIAAISPAQRHYDETANTLFFAAKCANIQRETEKQLTPHELEVSELKATIEHLRMELAETRAALASDTRIMRERFEDTGTCALVERLRSELQEEKEKNEALFLQNKTLKALQKDK